MKVDFINFKREYQIVKKELKKSLEKVGRTGQYILGDELKKFEKKSAKFLGVKFAVGVGNWTEGMIMTLNALNFKKSDEIITVSNSFIATAGAIAYYGAKPIFVDVANDLNIDVELIEQKITKNTKAIMPVHMSGIPANLEKIKKICRKHNLFLIEDAAHAFGAKYRNKYIGSFGDVSLFSLHPRKNFHVFGDGGLIVTNNKFLYNKFLLIRNHGLVNRNESLIWGTNSRLDNMQACFANSIFNKVNDWNAKHYEIAKFYNKNLTDKILKPRFDPKISKPTFHQYIIRTNKRNKLIKFLNSRGIQTAIHYPKPIHQNKAYTSSNKKIKLPKTEKFSKEILSLPIYHTLKLCEMQYIVDNVNQFFKN